MKKLKMKTCGAIAAGVSMFASAGAQAAGGAGTKFLGADFSYNGFLRLEAAVKTTSDDNYWNQNAYKFNGQTIRRVAGNPVGGFQMPLAPGQAIYDGLGLDGLPIQIRVPANGITSSDSNRDGVPNEHSFVNYHALRFEATPTLAWGNFSIITRIRALYDPGGAGYVDFDPAAYRFENGGIKGGLNSNYSVKPNYFGYRVEGNSNPVPLEFSGRNYLVDLPAFFAQYQQGPLTLRIGNQTVAWGQALFFRVFDAANGLDLRRHLILDRAIEEYADERASALGGRLTWQATDQIVADAFVQKFQPSVLPNPNTPYNIIPSQFTIRDRYSQYGYDNEINYGLRVKGDFGNYALQAFAIRRFNPLGTFRWTRSDVNQALPNDNALGAAFNQYCNLVLGTGGQGCGPILANTPFEVAPAGVFSAEEWFYYAPAVRVNPVKALNSAINDFAASQQLLAQPVDNTQAANNQLDAFFIAGDGLHGHIERIYVPETLVGLGGTYVTEAEPGSIFDQLIINLEGSYTPSKATAFSGGDDLSQRIYKTEEFVGALVLEKYQRFSTDFPATYLLAQYLYQSKTDLVGRSLRGYGGRPGSNPLPSFIGGQGTQPQLPDGVTGAHYVALAFLQPFPNYIWEVSAATLIDPRGSILVQPAVQWKPQGNLTVNLFYNYVNGHLFGANPNNTLLSTVSFADEIGIRLGFQF